MGRRLTRAVVCAAVAMSMIAPARALAVGRETALGRALDYLHARQYANGGFGEPGRGSSEQLTAWGIVAITAAGENPNSWRRGPSSPVNYLSRMSSRWSTTTDYARALLAACAAGRDPRRFGGINLIAKIREDVHTDGSRGDRIGPAVNSHVWAMIALRAAGRSATGAEVRWLKSQQNSDGGWGRGVNVASDSNDTAAAIEALVANGEERGSRVVRRAIDYLHSKQRSDGGFSYSGGASDTSSTSRAIQALAAARESVGGSRWRRGRNTPVTRLCALQAANGAMRYMGSRVQNPLLMTVQAIPALALRAFPVHFSPSLRNSRGAGPVFHPLRPTPNSSLPKGAPVEVKLTVGDAYGTGVVPGSIKVRVDGALRSRRVSGTNVEVEAGVLSIGMHTVSAQAADRAGNVSSLSDWHFAVGTTVPTPPGATPGTDPEGGTGTATTSTPQGGLTSTDTGQSQGATVAPGVVPGQTSPEQMQGGGQAATGNVDNWGSAVEVEAPSKSSPAAAAKQFGSWLLIGLAFLVPTVAAVGIITWTGNRRARRKQRRRAERAAAQKAAEEQAQQAAALQQATTAQYAAQQQAAAEQQWTPEQWAAWQQQQVAAEQQWTPEQVAAWQQQQAAQQPASEQAAVSPYEQLSPEQEAAWQAWEAQQAGQQQAALPQEPQWTPEQVAAWQQQQAAAQQQQWTPEQIDALRRQQQAAAQQPAGYEQRAFEQQPAVEQPAVEQQPVQPQSATGQATQAQGPVAEEPSQEPQEAPEDPDRATHE